MTLPGKSERRSGAINEDLRESLRIRYELGETELFVPLADIARRSGQPEQALTVLERGIERWSWRVGAWIQLARVKAQLGRLDEANAHYRHVLEAIDPRNLPALRALAVASVSEGNLEAAEGYLQGWAEVNPDDPELEDLQEELSAMSSDPSTDDAKTDSEGTPSRGIMEMSLSDLDEGFIEAPSVADGSAWSGKKKARGAGAGGKGS